MESLNVSPEGVSGGGSGGGGPEDDPGYPKAALRTHGFLVLAFGIALGLAFMIFFGLLSLANLPNGTVKDFVSQVNPNLWFSFLFGFVGGVAIAAVYNILVVRRVGLFGLESNMD